MRELDKARAYAESLIKNAPDPVFVSDLEGKILQANDAASELLGFRPAELVEQSLSRFISPEEAREFTAALREVVERGVTRNARLNPRSASGEVIPTTLNASALRDQDGNVIGAIGILRDMREYLKVVRDLEESKAELQDKILDLEKFEEVVVGRELKMIALEKEAEKLRREVGQLKGELGSRVMASAPRPCTSVDCRRPHVQRSEVVPSDLQERQSGVFGTRSKRCSSSSGRARSGVAPCCTSWST